MRIRFIIVDSARADAVEGLDLRERYDGDGIVVFEVPCCEGSSGGAELRESDGGWRDE
jgi:hypothetical protein